MRRDDGRWRAKWMHLYLGGYPRFNRAEGNHDSAALLMRGIIERDFLTVGYLADLVKANGATVRRYADGSVFQEAELAGAQDSPPGP